MPGGSGSFKQVLGAVQRAGTRSAVLPLAQVLKGFGSSYNQSVLVSGPQSRQSLKVSVPPVSPQRQKEITARFVPYVDPQLMALAQSNFSEYRGFDVGQANMDPLVAGSQITGLGVTGQVGYSTKEVEGGGLKKQNIQAGMPLDITGFQRLLQQGKFYKNLEAEEKRKVEFAQLKEKVATLEKENDTLKGSQLQDNEVLESLRDKLVAVTKKLEESGLEIDGDPADLKPQVSASEMQQTAVLTPEEAKKAFLNIYRPKENPLKQQRPPGQRVKRSIELSGSLEKPKDTLQNPNEPEVEYQDVYNENTSSLEEVPNTDNPMDLAKQLLDLRKQYKDLAAENERLQGALSTAKYEKISQAEAMKLAMNATEEKVAEIDKLQKALSSRYANDQSLQDLFASNKSLFITGGDLKVLQALQQSRVERPFQGEQTPERQALEMGVREQDLSYLLKEYDKSEGKNLLNALQLGQIYRDYEAKLSYFQMKIIADTLRDEKLQVSDELSTAQQVNQDLSGQLHTYKDDKAVSTASLQQINTQLLGQYKTLKEAVDKAEKDSPSSEGVLNLVPLGQSKQLSPSQLSEQAVTNRYQIKEEDSVKGMIAKNRDLAQLVALCQQQINAAKIEALVGENNKMASLNSQLEQQNKKAGEEYTSTVEELKGKIVTAEKQNSDLEVLSSRLQSDTVNLSRKLDEATDAVAKKDRQIQSLNSSYEGLQSENGQLLAAYTRLGRDIEQKSDFFETKSKEVEALRQKVQSELDDKLKELTSVREALNVAESQLLKVGGENNQLQQAVTTAENTSKEVEASREKVQSELEQVKNALDQKDSALKASQDQAAGLLQKFTNQETAISTLQQENKTQQSANSELSRELDELKTAKTSQGQELKKVQSALKESNTEKKQLSDELSQAKETLIAAQNSHAKDLDALRAQQDVDLEAVKEALVKQEDEGRGLQKQLVEAINQRDDALVQIETLNDAVQKSAAKILTQIAEIQQKEQQVISLQDESAAQLKNAQEAQEALETKNNELTKALSAKEAELQVEQSSLSQSVEKQGELQTALDGLESQLATLREKESSLQVEMGDQAKVITALQGENSSQSKEVTALQEQIEKVKNELQESKEASQQASKQSQQAVEKLTGEKKGVEEELKGLRLQQQKEQQAFQGAMAKLQAEYKSQRDDLAASQKEGADLNEKLLATLSGKEALFQEKKSLADANKGFQQKIVALETMIKTLQGKVEVAESLQAEDSKQQAEALAKSTRKVAASSKFIEDIAALPSQISEENLSRLRQEHAAIFDATEEHAEAQKRAKESSAVYVENVGALDNKKLNIVLAQMPPGQSYEELKAKINGGIETVKDVQTLLAKNKEGYPKGMANKERKNRQENLQVLQYLFQKDSYSSGDVPFNIKGLTDIDADFRKVYQQAHQAAMASKQSAQKLAAAKDTYTRSLGEMKQEMVSTAEDAIQAAVEENTKQLQSGFAAEKSRIEEDHKKALERAGMGYSDELGGLQKKLDASDQEKQSLQNDLTSAQNQASSLNKEIAKLQAEYESQGKGLAASQTEGAKLKKVTDNLIEDLRAQVSKLTDGKKDTEGELEALRTQLKKDQETSSREQDFMKKKLAQIERQRHLAQEKLDIFLNSQWSPQKIDSFARDHDLGSLAGESRNNVEAYLQKQAVAKVDFQAAKQRSTEAESSFKGAEKAFNDFFKGYEGVLLGDKPGASGNQPKDNTQICFANFKKTAKCELEGRSQQGKKGASGLSSNFFSDPKFSYQGGQSTFNRYINQGEITGPNKRKDIKPFDRARFRAVSLAYYNAWQENLAAKSTMEAATKESTAYDPDGKKETKLLESIQQDAQNRQAEANVLDVLQTKVSTLESDLKGATLREQELINTNTTLGQKITTLEAKAAIAREESAQQLAAAEDRYKQSLGKMQQEMASTVEDAKQAAVTANTEQLQSEFAAEIAQIEEDHKKYLKQADVDYSESLGGLQQDMKHLKESLSQKDDELTTLRGALDKAEGAMKLNTQLQTRIAEFEKQVEEQESALKKQFDAFSGMEGKVIEQYKEHEERQSAEIAQLTLDLQKVTEDLEAANEKNALLNKQNKGLKEEGSKDSIDLRKANKALQGDKEVLEVAQSEQQEENEALRMQVKELETRLAASSEASTVSEKKVVLSALFTNTLNSKVASLTSQVAEKDEHIRILTQEIAQLRQQNLSLSTTPQNDAFARDSSALSDQQEVAGGNIVVTPRARSDPTASSSSKNSRPNQGGDEGGSLSPELVRGRSAPSGNQTTSSRDSNSSIGSLHSASIGRESIAPSEENDPSSLKPGQDFCLEYARTEKDEDDHEVVIWDDQVTFEANKQHYAHAEQVTKTVSSSSGDGGEKTYPTELADNAYHTVRATWSNDSQAEKAGHACMEAYLEMMGGIEAVAALYGQAEALKQAKSGNMDALLENLTHGEKAIPISGSKAFQDGARAALMSRVREVSPKNDFRNRLRGVDGELKKIASIGSRPPNKNPSAPFDLRSLSSRNDGRLTPN